jgi:hypothetical protein
MKGIKVCLILLAVMFVSSNTEVQADELFQNFNMQMMTNEVASEPLSEEDRMLFKMFLAEDPSTVTPSPFTPSPSTPAVPSTWDNLIGAFDKLTNNWKRIVDTFKTTRSSEIKERIMGKGFDYFKQSAQIQISKGVKGEYIDKFIAHLQSRIKVPADRQGDLAMVLEETKWSESNVWTAFDTLFSIDNGGSTKFASILVSRNEDKDTYDFVFTDVKADFKLAPDTLVVHKKLSVLGGIWEDDKDVMVKVPKSITPEDVNTVLQFFQIVAFKGFAEQFGIKLEFPKM